MRKQGREGGEAQRGREIEERHRANVWARRDRGKGSIGWLREQGREEGRHRL